MKNKFLAAIFSVIVAFGLWMYVITVVSPESEKTYYDIPVVLQNKEILTQRGLMIVSETPKVTLALKSDRATLNDLNENNINVITNLANVETSGTHNLTYTISYPGNVPSGSVSVLNSSTEMITLKVENRITKKVPIVVIPKKDAEGTDTALPLDYLLKKTEFATKEDNKAVSISDVEISGPESVVSQITQAVVDVDLNNRTKTFTQSEIYTLCDEEGKAVNAEKVTTNVDVVEMTLTVHKMKKITLNANVTPGMGAAAENVTVTFSPASVVIAGDEAQVDKVEDTVTVEVVLAEYLEDTKKEISIKNHLQGLEILAGSENIQMDIVFSGVTTKTFTVPVQAVNVPEDYEIESMTQTVGVTVRGPSQDVENMTEADLQVVVNCEDMQEGIQKGEAAVSCPQYPNVIPVENSYMVSVVLKEIPKAPPAPVEPEPTVPEPTVPETVPEV